MYRIKYYILIFVIHSTCLAQSHTVNLFLQGCKYDSLFLFGTDVCGAKVKIYGNPAGEYGWSFAIPDTLYATFPGFQLSGKSTNSNPYSAHNVRFNYLRGRDTVSIMEASLPDSTLNIKARYWKRNQYADDSLVRKNGLNVLQKEPPVLDEFMLDTLPSVDFAARIQDPFFCAFQDGTKEEAVYARSLAKYVSESQQYPDSKYFITSLAAHLPLFRERGDVARVYVHLSAKYKESEWGIRIQRYLELQIFRNSMLPTANTHRMESIIRDTTKYNLVLFSASWCKPCRDEIPLLKQIYNDLKGKLEMVYVSMDEPDTANNWQKLMEKERVSWRSVLAAHDTGSIKKMYCVDGIPQIYLVHPGTNKVELIDINLPLQKQRLYQLINALP